MIVQKLFKLPCPSTLRKTMAKLNVRPGLSQNIFDLLKIKVTAMQPEEKLCSISVDEMSIKSDLSYNPQIDEIEGYEDFGSYGKTSKIATHALVFMVRGIMARWKQPVAYILSNGPCKADLIINLLRDIITQIVSVGLVPKILVSDQGSNNQAVFNKLNVTQERPFFTLAGVKIFALPDPPHLLKSVRNNLKLHGFISDGKTVEWDHIYQFYKMDSKSPIRLAPKLKLRHLLVPAFSHLNVALATQVRTSQFLYFYICIYMYTLFL